MGSTPQGPAGLYPPGQPKPFQDLEYEPATAYPEVSWKFDRVDPPAAYYVDADDTLHFGLYSLYTVTGTFTMNYRLLTPEGRIESGQLNIANVGGQTLYSQDQQLRKGFLLSVEVVPSFANGIEGILVWGELRRRGGGITNGARLLFNEYLENYRGLGWPDRTTRRTTDGRGFTQFQQIANPAAGADFTSTVGGGFRRIYRCIGGQLVTSAAVATRQVALKITDGTHTVVLNDALASQVASLTYFYTFYSGSFAALATGTHIPCPIPGEFQFQNGWTIGTQTANLQAGDQWSAIWMHTEEWVDGI